MAFYIYKGDSEYYKNIMYTVGNEHVYKGDSQYSSDIVYTFDDEYVYKGDSYYRKDIVYTYDDKYVYEGDRPSPSYIKYTIANGYVYEGDSIYPSDIIYTLGAEGGAPGTGCFVTTACIQSQGLSKDCYELELLRKFRDEWVRTHANGEEEIGIYYDIAPKIIAKINTRPDAAALYDKIYKEMILECVKHIEAGENEEAYTLYKNYSYSLKDLTDNM